MRTVLRFIRLLAAVLLATVLAGVAFAQQQATLLGTLGDTLPRGESGRPGRMATEFEPGPRSPPSWDAVD